MTEPGSFKHIVEREFLHLAASGTVNVLAFTGFDLLRRRFRALEPLRGWWAYIVPAFAAAGVIFLREPFDVMNEPSIWWKSYLDYATWVIGQAAMTYYHYRMTPRHWEIHTQIQLRRRLRDL